MKSTGEVMGLDRDFGRAFAKSQLAAGVRLPQDGTAFISVRERDKAAMVPLARQLLSMGFQIIATRGTARFLASRGEGTHHICFAVADIDAALSELKSQGVRLIDETPRQGVHGLVAFVHPKATNGVMIELLQKDLHHS